MYNSEYACINSKSCDQCGSKKTTSGRRKKKFMVNGGITIDSKEIGSLEDCQRACNKARGKTKVEELIRVQDADALGSTNPPIPEPLCENDSEEEV